MIQFPIQMLMYTDQSLGEREIFDDGFKQPTAP